MNLRTVAFATVLLTVTTTVNAFASEPLVAIRIEGKKCTLAASDTVMFKSIRDIIVALKSREIVDITITDEQPEKLRRDAEYIALKWTLDHVHITATGRTKHGYITTITSMLAESGIEETTISVVPEPSESIEKLKN